MSGHDVQVAASNFLQKRSIQNAVSPLPTFFDFHSSFELTTIISWATASIVGNISVDNCRAQVQRQVLDGRAPLLYRFVEACQDS